MKRYTAYIRQSFLANSAFRFDTFLGILDNCLKVFIFWCIYRALYGANDSVDGISFQMVTTNFVLSIGLSTAYAMDENWLPYRIGNGSISNELLKPISVRGILLATDLGNICFRMLFQFLPALLFAIGVVGLQSPASLAALAAFVVSAMLGFLVLWNLNFVIQTFGFWIINVWSVNTIKNVIVNILSGTMLPLWFLPDWLSTVVKLTPFSAIYFIPVEIYLGTVTGAGILEMFLRQCVWIAVLYLIGEALFRCGIRKLVVQGG